MIRRFLVAALLAASSISAAGAQAQPSDTVVPVQTISGTRLDVVATGEVTRVPDIARISAGVVTQAPTASAALAQNAQRMESVVAALRRAGIAERDIQTSSINLHPDYRHDERGAAPPQLIGYRASNEVSVRFRDIANAGKVIDALVAEGANQINGPTLTIDKPDAALDEARAKAVVAGRARADLYARSMGLRVVRIVAVSESGGSYPVPPSMPMMAQVRAEAADSKIDPGEQKLQVNLAMTFELQ